MHLRHLVRPLLTLTALAALALLPPSVASAAPGDYTVRLTTTAGTHWSTYGRGPFIATAQRVYSGIGIFETGDYRSWRAVVPGEGARIVGGRVVVTMSTPHANMRGRILVGSGNTPVVLYDGAADGAIERSITSGAHDWVQFDVRSIGAATASRVAENFVNLSVAELVLRDTVPPVLAALALPPAGQWHDAGSCIPFSIRLTDQGGGLLRSQVRRASDGVIVSELGTTQVQSPKPGPTEQHLTDCIQPHERAHGDTTFIATAWDVGGTARELAFAVRADQLLPTIVGGPDDGARFITARPDVSFQVADDGAGVASVSATLDGAPVAVAMTGSTARIEVGVVPIGSHVVAIAVVDGAGNARRVERRFAIADITAPTLVLESPGASGEATAWLRVRASDDMSGVDPARWVATVNGETVKIEADESRLTATIGPLAPGVQRIEVSTADRAGNAAQLQHAYQVASSPVPSMPNVGARSGAFLVESPPAAIGYGLESRIAVFVARNGRPMGGQLVELRRDGVVFGSATSDEQGIARIVFRAGAPGVYQAWVVGVPLDPADVPLRIAPRLSITTSTSKPRAGQRVTVSGRIIPAIRGRRVALEARIGGVWYPIRRSAATASNGRFRSHVVAATPGTVWVRVRLLAVGGWAPAASNERALVVRAAPRPRAQ